MSIDTTVIPSPTIDGDKIIGDIVLGEDNLKGLKALFKDVRGT